MLCETRRTALLVLALACLCRAASASDYFVSEPRLSPYFVLADQSGPTLDCSVASQYSKDSAYTLQWIKVAGGKPRIISIGETLLDQRYVLDRTASEGSYNLQIQRVSFEEDNANFFCQLTGPPEFGIEDSRPARVVVLVRAGPPEIFEQPGTPVQEGSPVSATCQSVGGNPPPTIKWYFANGTQLEQHLTVVTNATSLNSPTRSRISLRVSPAEDGIYLECRIWNEAIGDAPWPSTASRKITVLYSPRVTVGPTDVYNVEQGARAELRCTARANPPAHLIEWEQTGAPRSGNPQRWNGGNVSFTVDRDSAGNYTCTATNRGGAGRASLRLNVYYAPVVRVQPKLTAREGSALTLACEVDANPAFSSVTWLDPGGQELDTTDDHTSVFIATVSRSDAGNYTCTARNTLTLFGVGSVSKTGSDTTQVTVSYKPGTAKISSSKTPVVVGDSVTLSCRAEEQGIPAAQFRWRVHDRSDYIFNSMTVYTLNRVQLSQAGDYCCEPWNDVGDGTEACFSLVVFEPATLSQYLPVELEKTQEDSGVSLQCRARGNPAPEISWFKDGVQIAPTSQPTHWSIEQNKDAFDCDRVERCPFTVTGILQWRDDVRWDDAGQYVCHAYNGAGEPMESATTIKVRHRPVVVNARNQDGRGLAATNIGEVAEIECRTSSRPQPTFRWYFGGAELVSDGYRVAFKQGRNETADVYSSTLVLQPVDERSLGDYLCKAENSFGVGELTFLLQLKDKPQMPTGLRVAGATGSSLMVVWTPGFDGGFEQSFVLEVDHVHPLTGKSSGSATAYEVRLGDRSRRQRRHAGIERPVASMNITGLMPLARYEFRVRARNTLGNTPWTSNVEAATEEVLTDLELDPPYEASYDSSKNSLAFAPAQDSGRYCLLIYVRSVAGAPWRSYDCVAPTGNAAEVPAVRELRVRYCRDVTPLRCSDAVDVVGKAPVSQFPASIVPILVVVVAVLLVVGVLLLCCCWLRQGQTAPDKRRLKHASNARADFETEGNRARPMVSSPYVSAAPDEHAAADEKARASASGVHGSRADSGFFTMGYDAMPMGNLPDEFAYANGAMRASYDEGVDRWGSAADPYGEYGGLDAYNGTLPYEPGDVGGVGGYGGGDERGSMASGFATPSQRGRIMREIIV